MTLVAFLGDIHGAWDHAATKLDRLAAKHGPLAFAVAVGDSEPYRTEREMEGSTSPPKHRKLGTYPEVFAGRLSLACPVHFIGGNHDPYPALDELGAGNWGPNTHYLGRSGVQEIDGVRVGFLSGIYSDAHFHTEREPPTKGQQIARKRMTHYTEGEVARLRAVGRVDVLVTHDWPLGVPEARYKGDAVVRSLHEPLSPSLHVAGHNHFTRRAHVAGVSFHALNKAFRWHGVALYRFGDGRAELLAEE